MLLGAREHFAVHTYTREEEEHAQRHEPLGDIATKVVFENDRVKIWNLIVEPGQASDWHLHPRDYVTIVVDGGGLTVEFDDGTVEEGQREIGSWRYHDTHIIHRVVNNTGKTFKNVLVELKG